MGSPRPPYLILIRNGPSYDIDDRLAHIARAFAARYPGEMCTYGPYPEDKTYDGFRVRLVRVPFGSRIWRRIPFAMWVVWRGLRARWLQGFRVVVITYDPFQSGSLGVLIKWLTGGRLICEVNGDFAHPETLVSNRPRSQAAQRTFLAVGSGVLRQANIIKHLYPGQLATFDLRDEKPPRIHFFNVVDARVFDDTAPEPEDLLLFAGHPFLLKGVDLLVEAFKRVADDFPTWKLVLIGHRVEEHARAAGVTEHPRILFLGPQTPPVLAVWMGRCKALVLPSRTEAMGRVLIEAAFRGRARIGSTAGGIPTVIEDGTDGLLFESGSADQLERVLRRFMSDRDLQVRLGRHAAERARREFTVERYQRFYFDLIDSVLGEDTVRCDAG